MSPKINLTNNRSGKYLYKYLPFNQYSLQILIDEKLWLGSPDLLNDPFEGDFVIKNYKDLHCREIIDLIFKKEDNNSDDLTRALYSAKYDSILNNKLEFLNILNDYISNRIKNNSGSTSFSKDCKTLKMWSHYADSHKGFVIIFDREKLDSAITDFNSKLFDLPYCKTQLIDVEYGSLSIIDLVPVNDDILIRDDYNFLSRKLNDWKREKEVRIIMRKIFKNDSQRFLKFNFDCIEGIIYGQRMLPQNAFTISNIIDNKRKKIKFYSSQKNLKRNKIIFNEILFKVSNK
jgi:hypothetical protein